MSKILCPDCRGDGKETCHNPDHPLITAVGTMRLNKHGNGCPGCGNDPNHKIRDGGDCPTCKGEGKVTPVEAMIFCDEMGYDYESLCA